MLRLNEGSDLRFETFRKIELGGCTFIWCCSMQYINYFLVWSFWWWNFTGQNFFLHPFHRVFSHLLGVDIVYPWHELVWAKIIFYFVCSMWLPSGSHCEALLLQYLKSLIFEFMLLLLVDYVFCFRKVTVNSCRQRLTFYVIFFCFFTIGWKLFDCFRFLMRQVSGGLIRLRI